MLDKQEYGAWGNVRAGNISETTLSYTGQKRDGTGLLYYGARYYDPAVGRFLSPGGIGIDFKNPQMLNRYAYVGSNPLTVVRATNASNSDDRLWMHPRAAGQSHLNPSRRRFVASVNHRPTNRISRPPSAILGIRTCHFGERAVADWTTKRW